MFGSDAPPWSDDDTSLLRCPTDIRVDLSGRRVDAATRLDEIHVGTLRSFFPSRTRSLVLMAIINSFLFSRPARPPTARARSFTNAKKRYSPIISYERKSVIRFPLSRERATIMIRIRVFCDRGRRFALLICAPIH